MTQETTVRSQEAVAKPEAASPSQVAGRLHMYPSNWADAPPPKTGACSPRPWAVRP